ncbi:bifunctional NadR-like protein [Synechococcus phage S-CREM1]|nr:bifunctional NadR-like protein [Synechococcus phage S-CREM1]
MKRYTNFLSEAKSKAAAQAEKLGLVHVGYGKYANPRTKKVVYRSEGGEKLVKVSPKDAGLPTDHPAAPEQDAAKSPEQGMSITLTFGRFNPPTIGHEKLIQQVASAAKQGDFRIYPSRSQDPTKNPLDPNTKAEWMKKMFPDYADAIVNDEGMRNIFDVLKAVAGEGYTEVNIVVGSDRVSEFQNLAQKYNGSLYNFNNIQVISAGERDADAEDVSGMSASKMRKAAMDDDFESFKKGIPDTLKDPDKEKLFRTLQDAMHATTKVAKETWEYAPELDYENLREAYFNEEIFTIGSLVENLDTGITGKVIHRGTNYVIYVDQFDTSHRGWLTQLNEGEDPRTQWEVGTDKYRDAVQQLTPGQPKITFGGWMKKVKITK